MENKTITVEIPITTYQKYFEDERIDKVEFLPLKDGA